MTRYLKGLIDRYFKVYFAICLMGFVLTIVLMTVPKWFR